jgi:hypothetical protein
MNPYLTPTAVARRLGIGKVDRILKLIHDGDLRLVCRECHRDLLTIEK